jgi:hypothetical protein
MKGPETITIEKLRSLTKSRGPVSNAAKRALPDAESAAQRGTLASILLDRHLRHVQVYCTN